MLLFVSMWYSCRILFLTFVTICYVYYFIILVYFINKPARVPVPNTIIVSVAKKTSNFRNKMYYIFGEYKVQDSKLTPLYHVSGIIADIKVCKLYV